MAIACMAATMGALGVSLPTWTVNALELGGEHGGLTYTFVNNLSNLAGIVAPIMCGILVDRLGDRAGFTAAFWLAAGLNVLGMLVFVTFVSVKTTEDARAGA